MELPGGGGFGSPLERDPRAVLRDVVEGKVSIEAAEREYGVMIRCNKPPEDRIALPENYELDRAETVALRERLMAAREPTLRSESQLTGHYLVEES